MAEKSTGRQLKVLRTDNGGEYTSSEFQDFLKKEGIRHELTVPKTPEQNGVAERMNKTLMETVRSMLADAKLPQKFWAEALSTAVYLRNRSPTKSVKGMTPFEAWTGEKPTVDHLRIFGCTVYAHVPKDERKKLDPKAKKCILLGYGTETKGYRLYDSKLAKVFFSRDVIFNESDHAFKKEPVANEDGAVNRYVELDCQEPDNEESPEQKVQRSARLRKPPDYYGEWVTIASNPTTEPKTVKDVLSSPDKANWKEAMEKEMESLYAISVWNRVELPKGRKAVGSKWVFKVKVDADGTFERHKARLVTQGFSQKFGSDYDETFSPVVRFESVRTIIAQAVQYGLKLHQMDVKTAFLNGELKEEVYMQQPEGFVVKGKEHLVCKLNHSIYGPKQSPRCWNIVLDEQLKKMGFVQTTGDPCIYTAATDWAGDQDNRKSMSGYMFQSVEQL
ncbi:Retrovirus-related Pol poly from transposon TNT 1-94 [Labeo rohita]|uniref:Retrovirus-related Pol poly from transposon TNT 1-94 n=1 Tax=Labeo rohita TaxID=84645 RepID=A0A498NC17_LABRO|nr:Retrovirus-related Pol poly from transposon TNT 1-94 [Labeo rohita]